MEMEEVRAHIQEKYGEEYIKDENFKIAYRKVKKIKGFYSHLKVYVFVNVIIIFSSLNRNFFGSQFEESGLFDLDTYSTAIPWGIALLIHGFVVFGRDVFFSNDWEQKKIQKFMEKEKENSKRWE